MMVMKELPGAVVQLLFRAYPSCYVVNS